MECGGRGSKYKGQNTLIVNLKSPISPTRALAARGLNENHFFLNLSRGHGPSPRFFLSCPLIGERDGGVGKT